MASRDASVDPNKLSVETLAKLLTQAGPQPVSKAAVDAAIASGAPTNPDGTIHLIHFLAWLVRSRT